MILAMNNSDLMFIIDKANISEPFVDLYLNNKKIFISGGTGFIGKWLVASLKKITELTKVNFDIYILTRDSEQFKYHYPELSQGIFFINGPIENEKTFRDLDIKFDYVFHLAGETTKGPSYLTELAEIAISGTNNVLKFIVSESTKYFFFASSGAVYSSFTEVNKKLKESDPCVSNSAYQDEIYALSKRLCEKILEENLAMTNCTYINLRIFALVGPSMYFNKHYAFGNFIMNAAKGEDVKLATDGNVFRSFMHIRDFMIWILKILDYNEKLTPLYLNVGSDQAITIRELAEKIAKKYSLKLRVSRTPTVNKKYYVPDIELANSLGLKIYTSLDDSIDMTYKSITSR